MKSSTSGIVKLLFSILVILLFHFFYWKVFSWVGIHFSGTTKEIMEFVKYLLVSIIIFVIYRGKIRAGKNKFNKNLLNNVIYSVACFVFLIVVTIAVNKLLHYLGKNVGYNFTNYFNDHFSLSFVLNLIRECLFIPFLLCVIFPLGFSDIFKKSMTASIAAGLSYGILYGVMLNTTFENALVLAITPAMIVLFLTYLYKTNQNIWSVIITYISYVLFGIFLINYI